MVVGGSIGPSKARPVEHNSPDRATRLQQRGEPIEPPTTTGPHRSLADTPGNTQPLRYTGRGVLFERDLPERQSASEGGLRHAECSDARQSQDSTIPPNVTSVSRFLGPLRIFNNFHHPLSVSLSHGEVPKILHFCGLFK